MNKEQFNQLPGYYRLFLLSLLLYLTASVNPLHAQHPVNDSEPTNPSTNDTISHQIYLAQIYAQELQTQQEPEILTHQRLSELYRVLGITVEPSAISLTDIDSLSGFMQKLFGSVPFALKNSLVNHPDLINTTFYKKIHSLTITQAQNIGYSGFTETTVDQQDNRVALSQLVVIDGEHEPAAPNEAFHSFFARSEMLTHHLQGLGIVLDEAGSFLAELSAYLYQMGNFLTDRLPEDLKPTDSEISQAYQLWLQRRSLFAEGLTGSISQNYDTQAVIANMPLLIETFFPEEENFIQLLRLRETVAARLAAALSEKAGENPDTYFRDYLLAVEKVARGELNGLPSNVTDVLARLQTEKIIPNFQRLDQYPLNEFTQTGTLLPFRLQYTEGRWGHIFEIITFFHYNDTGEFALASEDSIQVTSVQITPVGTSTTHELNPDYEVFRLTDQQMSPDIFLGEKMVREKLGRGLVKGDTLILTIQTQGQNGSRYTKFLRVTYPGDMYSRTQPTGDIQLPAEFASHHSISQ